MTPKENVNNLHELSIPAIKSNLKDICEETDGLNVLPGQLNLI